ncbi:MAG TPA: preprotein translocase subunit SecE [Actinomycetota bacterium]|jgi:preprotein translocase SecE subunit|nr:preprotein translocase subunit SecE [Actinomycetota bacterium]
MATDGEKQGKEAVKPAGGAKPASGRAKTAAKPAGRAAGTAGKSTSRPAGRAAAKPGDKAGAKAAAKPAAKTAPKPGAKPGAKPAARPARGATATARADKAAPKASAGKGTKTEEPGTDGTGTGVNREMKRAMKKREGAADRLKRAPTAPSRKRTKPLTFLKEVKGELGRVAWPTRNEVITYSVVVLVTVIFFMVVIAGIDYVALKGVLFLIDRGGR